MSDLQKKKVTKAVIPAAGFGTRFLPATKAVPKEMLPIVDKPALQYIVEEAVASGIKDILIINGRGKDAIPNHFDRHIELEVFLKEKNNPEAYEEVKGIANLANVTCVRQKEALGLGHAIYCAKAFVGDEPFAVLLGDDIVHCEGDSALKQLIDVYDEKGASVLGVQTVEKSAVSRYGIVGGKQVSDRLYEVEVMVEKPKAEDAPSNVAILGRYILTPEIFEELEKTVPGSGGEIQLTDGIIRLMSRQKVYAYDFIGRRYDTGNKLGYLEATVEYALRHGEVGEDFKKYIKAMAEKI